MGIGFLGLGNFKEFTECSRGQSKKFSTGMAFGALGKDYLRIPVLDARQKMKLGMSDFGVLSLGLIGGALIHREINV